MKRITALVGAALALALATPVLAGSGGKCSQDAQTCLNHFSSYREQGWLGLKYDANEKGEYVVKTVTEGSPAAKAGFQLGDVLLTLNGASMSDKEAVKKAKGEWKVGSQVSYTIRREKNEQQVTATLAAMPEEVFAAMVGDHMIKDHMGVVPTEKAAKAKY